MTKIHKRRMRKLIAFLRELPRDKFDYSNTVTQFKNNCGTVCCAIGWTPHLFPRIAVWRKFKLWDGSPKMGLGIRNKNNGTDSYPELSEFLFGIPDPVTEYLFNPFCSENSLSCGSTPKQVALHLEKWLNKQP
jgi:hypothetical protein